MFRFTRNHHQALSKNTHPLHKAIKTRFGIPNVHNKLLVMVHMSLLLLFDLDICLYTFLNSKTLKLCVCVLQGYRKRWTGFETAIT